MASIERDHYSDYVNKRKREYLDAVALDLAINRHPHKEPVRVVRPVELKGVDHHEFHFVPLLSGQTATDGVLLINSIREGTGSFERIGRNVWMESVRVRGFIRFFFQPEANFFPYIRLIIVYDRTPSGAQPVFSDVFQITDSGGSDSTPAMYCPVAFENTKRFRVLSDWEVQCPSVFTQGTLPGTATDYHLDVPFDKYIPLKNLESQYSGTGVGISNISTGGLYLFYITSYQLVNGSPPPDRFMYSDMDCIVRLRYRD